MLSNDNSVLTLLSQVASKWFSASAQSYNKLSLATLLTSMVPGAAAKTSERASKMLGFQVTEAYDGILDTVQKPALRKDCLALLLVSIITLSCVVWLVWTQDFTQPMPTSSDTQDMMLNGP